MSTVFRHRICMTSCLSNNNILLANCDNFALFHVRSEHLCKSFFTTTVIDWNALPITVQQVHTIGRFTSSLKTHEFYRIVKILHPRYTSYALYTTKSGFFSFKWAFKQPWLFGFNVKCSSKNCLSMLLYWKC